VALEGNLSTVDFPDVLQLLCSTRKTGVLHLRRAADWKRIYLRDGTVLLLSSSEPEDYIGDTLASLGKVSEEDLRRALVRQQREGKLVGAILVEEGKIEADVLLRYLRDRAYELIAKIVRVWTDAEFRFEEYALPPFDLIPLDLSVGQLLMEGVRRSDEINRLRERLPDDEVVLERTEEIFDDETMRSTLTGLVVSKLERPLSVRELKRELRTSEFALLTGITALIDRGFVKTSDRTVRLDPPARSPWLAEARKLHLAGMSEQAVERLRDGLKADPVNTAARTLLSQAEAALVRDLTRGELPLSRRLEVMRPLAELGERSLSPVEAFIVSRIGDDTDIEALLEATPLPVAEILLAVRRLMSEGILRGR